MAATYPLKSYGNCFCIVGESYNVRYYAILTCFFFVSFFSHDSIIHSWIIQIEVCLWERFQQCIFLCGENNSVKSCLLNLIYPFSFKSPMEYFRLGYSSPIWRQSRWCLPKMFESEVSRLALFLFWYKISHAVIWCLLRTQRSECLETLKKTNCHFHTWAKSYWNVFSVRCSLKCLVEISNELLHLCLSASIKGEMPKHI